MTTISDKIQGIHQHEHEHHDQQHQQHQHHHSHHSHHIDKSCCDKSNFLGNNLFDNNENNNPYDVINIPGSKKLSEFPLYTEDTDCNISTVCPKDFKPVQICVNNCKKFAALSNTNFINGDLIINNAECDEITCGILENLPIPTDDIIDIFPNLLGINGSLYIISTNYKKILGFNKLRFVTGSIIIVNNPYLTVIPTFPCLLNIGGQVISPPGYHFHNHREPHNHREQHNHHEPHNYHEPQYESDQQYESEQQYEHVQHYKREKHYEREQHYDCGSYCGKGVVLIANNSVLKKINSFEAVRQIKDGVFISDNKCLTHIAGFIHLYRTDRIVINHNKKLSKIFAFCHIDTVNIGLYITGNNHDGDNDMKINAFGNLDTVGKIIIINNNSLTKLHLDGLTIVYGNFMVYDNNHLQEIHSKVNTLRNLFIENNKNLHLIEFPCLQEVLESIHINNNNSLIKLNTFDNLKRVGEAIIITENRSLNEIGGFNSVKYIGSKCDKKKECEIINNCQKSFYDWDCVIKLLYCECECTVIDNFEINVYDARINDSSNDLPDSLFSLVCNAINPCQTLENLESCETKTADIITYSLIIYQNKRLKYIDAFANLRHVNSNIYIVYNGILQTIKSFGKLCFALDIWIRNNLSLKYIMGFNELLSVRDFIIAETPNIVDITDIKKLEFAQIIHIETKNSKALKLPKCPIPTVHGCIVYYSGCC